MPLFHVEAFAFAAAGSHPSNEAAWNAWQTYRARGVRPDQRVLISVLRDCEARRSADRALEVEKVAREEKIPLDGPLYWSMLRTYGTAGRADDVARLLSEMDSRSMLTDRHTLTAAVTALVGLRKAGQAWDLFGRMKGNAGPGLYLGAQVMRAIASAPPDSDLPSYSAVGTHFRKQGLTEAESAAVLVRGLDLAGVLPDEKRVMSAVSDDISEVALCAALLRLHAAHNDLDGAQQVVHRLGDRGRQIPPALWEMLFRLFRARNLLPKALHAADQYERQMGSLSKDMVLGLLELGINYNAPDTVFMALRHVQAASILIPEQLLRATMRLLYRFGKKEPARQLIASVKSRYPAPVWRNLEAFVAAENMADLLPKA